MYTNLSIFLKLSIRKSYLADVHKLELLIMLINLTKIIDV